MSSVFKMPNQFRLVDLYKEFNQLGLPMPVLALDADLNLFPAMSTATTDQQKAILKEFDDRTDGGSFFITGRSHESMEETTGRPVAGAFEHGSAVRLEEGGDVISLVSKADTAEMARIASGIIVSKLGEDIIISDTPELVWEYDDVASVVFPEVKPHALAMVHSQGHALVEAHRGVFELAAHKIIEEMGLEKTHGIARGGDAIEVVSRRLTKEAEINLRKTGQVSDATIERFHGKDGVGKAQGLHLFMGLDRYKDSGRLPYGWGDSIGDSGTDGKMFVACAEYSNGGKYGGGIATLNDRPVSQISKEFHGVIGMRILPEWQGNFDQIRDVNTYLAKEQRIYGSAEVPASQSTGSAKKIGVPIPQGPSK